MDKRSFPLLNLTNYECEARSVKLLHLLVLVLSIGLSLFASENCFAISIKSQSGDFDVGRVDGELRLLAVDLLLDQLFDVDAPSAAVAGLNLAGTTLVGAAHNLDCITLAYGDATYVVFRF